MRKGEVRQDFWFYLAVWISVLAIVGAITVQVLAQNVWAWVIAILVVAACMLLTSIRGWRENRDVVWTEEEKKEFRQRQLRRTLRFLVPFAATGMQLISNNLTRDGILPAWVSCLMLPVVVAAWVWAFRQSREAAS